MSDSASDRDSKSADKSNDDSVLVVPQLPESEKVHDPREEQSPYFTIAAAGFGMISDGCACLYLFVSAAGQSCSSL